MQRHQQPLFSPDGFRSFMSVVTFAARSLAICGEVFLHRAETFGERYLGAQVGGALLLVFIFPICVEEYDPRPVFWFLAAFIFAVIRARLLIARRVRDGGPQPHTYYTGEPYLMKLFRRAKESSVKCGAEPMLMFLIAVFTLPQSEALGRFFLLVALGMFISNNQTAGYERRRAMDLNDAYISGRQAADDMRDMRRN